VRTTGARSGAAWAALALAASAGAACSSSATCQQFCHHYYADCKLTGYLGSTSEADCEMRCGDQADGGVCTDNGAKLGCLNGLNCSQLDLSTPDLVIENLGRYHVCDTKGGCIDGG
jgi:hypothetical protein